MKEFDEKNTELENASFLKKIKKDDVFKAPENYFQENAGLWQDKLEDEKVLEEAPILRSITKKNIFRTPEHYFERLSGQISAQYSTTIVKPFWQKTLFRVSIAASITLLISLGIWMNSVDSQELNPSLALTDIPTEILLASVDVNEYDVDMIVEAMGEDVLTEWGQVEHIHLDESEVSDILDQFDLNDLEAELMEDSN